MFSIKDKKNSLDSLSRCNGVFMLHQQVLVLLRRSVGISVDSKVKAEIEKHKSAAKENQERLQRDFEVGEIDRDGTVGPMSANFINFIIHFF